MIVKDGETTKVRWRVSPTGEMLSYMVNNVLCRPPGGVGDLTVWLRTRNIKRFYQPKVDSEGVLVHRFDIRLSTDSIDDFRATWAVPKPTIFEPPPVVDPIDRSCRQKRYYATRDEALGGVAHVLLRGRRNTHPGRTLRPYRCLHCDGWHTGHSYETADTY